MIRAVRSDKSEFKDIEFKKGFNIILAERTVSASDKDSRNGLGKSTLIDIIHFCLGAGVDPNKGLRVKELEGWTFILDITLRGKNFSIYRNTSSSSKITVEGDFSDWPIHPEYNSEDKSYQLKVSDWTAILGYLMFGLQPELKTSKYSPKFRSLMSYFSRRNPGAYQDPFKHYPQQLEWDIQVQNAFLLGLNWEYASELQILKDKQKSLKNLINAANQGLLVDFIGSIGELEAEKVRLEEEFERSMAQLGSFKVHPQYYDIQKISNKLTDQIHELTNKYTINQSILNKYKESGKAEEDVSLDKMKQIYGKAGLLFSDNVLQQIEDVVTFHKTVIENRKNYLNTEILRLSKEITDQEQEIENLSNERSELLNILNTHGALEEYSKLQNRAATVKQQLDEVVNRIANLQKLQEDKSALKIKHEELMLKMRRDYHERESQINKARRLFNKNSNNLYSEPGILSINILDAGYKFDVEIKRASSQGINYMKVFCYDLMLAQLRSNLADMPGFLIHDSTIFDGVDERQIAKALELAANEANSEGFQYICTLNSDIVPYADFPEGFSSKFKDAVRIILDDATEDGGLLGFRY
jgi:uncharacterized protein YydD (DUF2326 family)